MVEGDQDRAASWNCTVAQGMKALQDRQNSAKTGLHSRHLGTPNSDEPAALTQVGHSSAWI